MTIISRGAECVVSENGCGLSKMHPLGMMPTTTRVNPLDHVTSLFILSFVSHISVDEVDDSVPPYRLLDH